MGKKLSEMTLEELWQLFPIFLTEHQVCWKDWYLEEQNTLLQTVPFPVCMHHIGSTAVQGIWAKPIIDILIENNLLEKYVKLYDNNGTLLGNATLSNGWITLVAVPEPAEWAMILGSLALGFAMYRRRK